VAAVASAADWPDLQGEGVKIMASLDRQGLIVQIALALEGESLLDATAPSPQRLAEAERALGKVELYLGIRIEEAKDIMDKALEDLG
jgi:hypothetical protein